MSYAKHTEGPWLFRGDHVDDSHGIPLCRTTRRFEQLNCLDFHLIAAAPDLLEACERLVEDGECYCLDHMSDPCAHCLAKDVISDAKGEKP